MKNKLFNLTIVLTLLSASAIVNAEELPVSNGQMLYLPIYSNILHGDINTSKGKPMKSYMSALISIRNTSLKTPIKIESARYYNTEGKLLRVFVAAPKEVAPMDTLELFI